MKALAAALFALTLAAAQSPSPSPAERALALARRGRETGNPDYYRQAERVVLDALRAEPGNFETLKARAAVHLGLHEYSAALELARKLNQRTPDDVTVRGLIVDAALALGGYDEAEKQTQWMLNLRRGNLPGMIRGALLRADFGDIDGALDWLTSVFRLTNASQAEERAWLLTHIARLRLQTGKLDLAAELLDQSLQIFPEYYLTLDALAETRSAQGKFVDAVDLLRRAQKMAPSTRRLFLLAVALKQAGQGGEADRVFAEFERQAVEITGKPDNANRELIFYYADHAHKPADALRVAAAEILVRHDIATLDAYAWALYSNGEYAKAKAELDRALEIGVRDASLYRHAAAIADKLKDQATATKFERQARELRP